MKDKKPLDAEVATWLHEHGYPLEMTVAAALRKEGFKVVQSAYFLDREQAKPRELDVVATYQWLSAEINWQVTFVVECKVAKQPWVLFTLPTPQQFVDNGFQFYRFAASRWGRQFLSQVRRRDDIAGSGWFNMPARLAYGVRQAVSGNEDRPFEATVKLAKATAVYSTSFDTEEHSDFPIAHIVLPVVVLGGALFESYLSDESDLKVIPVEDGILDWSNPVPGAVDTLIRVVTEPALAQFVAQARKTVNYLQLDCTDAQAKIGKSWKADYDRRHRQSAEEAEPTRVANERY